MGIRAEQIVQSIEILSLSLTVIVFVGRYTIEGERIVGVLRAFLMENIVLAVVPVGERRMVRAGLLNWLRRADNTYIRLCGWLTLVASEPLFVCGLEVHGVGVDDLGLFLHVEGLLVVFDLSASKFVVVVLSVVREQRPWVRVTHETINAAGLTRALVPGRQAFERCVRPDSHRLGISIRSILTMELAEASNLILPHSTRHFLRR